MSEIAYLLRLLVQADKEAKVSMYSPSGEGMIVSTALTTEQTRKSFAVYNNSDSGSGDAYYGYTSSISPSGESMVIPKGSMLTIPVADTTDIDVYLIAASGEIANLRVEELA